MKTYITFGQIHVHSINGLTLDKDCVAAITHSKPDEGREKAMEWFDGMFHYSYTEEQFKERVEEGIMGYFPRGIIEVNP